mmetsp:Transcript_15651/g.38427  ORF Transcript_15651/g.38427 Transcript_15651/m.38427 type:complete len:206 (-) Transcript_15651:5577-6194(-)
MSSTGILSPRITAVSDARDSTVIRISSNACTNSRRCAPLCAAAKCSSAGGGLARRPKSTCEARTTSLAESSSPAVHTSVSFSLAKRKRSSSTSVSSGLLMAAWATTYALTAASSKSESAPTISSLSAHRSVNVLKQGNVRIAASAVTLFENLSRQTATSPTIACQYSDVLEMEHAAFVAVSVAMMFRSWRAMLSRASHEFVSCVA